MSDDLVKRLRNTPNWMREEYAHYKDGLKVFDRAPFEAAYALEAQAAEITRLRAELATARRDGMEEAAQIVKEIWEKFVNSLPEDVCLSTTLWGESIWVDGVNIPTGSTYEAAIRAALEGKKDE